MNKHILFLSAVILIFPMLTVADTSLKDFSGFTATTLSECNYSNPNAQGLGFYFGGDAYNSHIMHGYPDSEGSLVCDTKVDNFYSDPPTADVNQIEIHVYGESISSYFPICILNYNVLTKTAYWFVKNQYQPSKDSPPINCKLYVYPKHIFLMVTDDTESQKIINNSR